MKKILAILACLAFASCASSNRPPTIAELVARTYSADKYMAIPHPISDSARKARWAAFFNPSK